MVDPRSSVTVGSAEVEIRPMRRRHLNGVVVVEDGSNPHPWSKRLFENELVQPSCRSLVAIAPRAEVVGFATLMVVGGDAHVTNLGVTPPWRRRGVAARLMHRLMGDAAHEGVTDVTLEVRRSNTAAIALYRGLGFAVEGERPRYYPDNGEDAVIMWCRDLGPWSAAPAP
jgi:ribosomal-protein-alanine N-acetyltransferase